MSREAHRITKLLNWSCASSMYVAALTQFNGSFDRHSHKLSATDPSEPKNNMYIERRRRHQTIMFLPQVISAAVAIIAVLFSWETILDPNKGSIIETEAGENGIRNLLQQRHVADNKLKSRHLQGAPQHPDLANIATIGGKFSAEATFYQQGNRYIHLLQKDCFSKFNPDVEFAADSKASSNSEWTDKGGAKEVIPFEIPLKNFLNHIADDNGQVDICIQLETDNTFTNIQYEVKLDLTHETSAFSVDVKQPDAVVAGVTVTTQLTAWVCAGDDASPVIANKIDELEVPGKIYICIKCTDGYAIRRGELSADAAETGIGSDKTIANYMSLANGVTGQYSVDDTYQVMSTSGDFIRVSFMGDRAWAPVLSQSTLSITVDAYFEPVTGRLLASDSYEGEEGKKFQPGRLPIRGDDQEPTTSENFFHEGVEFSSFTTTVQLNGPSEEKKDTTAVMGCAIGAGILVFICCFYFILARKLRPDNKEENNNKAAVYPDVKSIVSSTTASTSASSISSIDSRHVLESGRTPGSGIKAMRDSPHSREAHPSIKSGRKSNGSAPPRNVHPRYNGTASRTVSPRDGNVPPRKVSPRSSKVPSRNVTRY